MREHLSIAALLVLLAMTGVEPGRAAGAKTCQIGFTATLLNPC
jgi:hypothetical protein